MGCLNLREPSSFSFHLPTWLLPRGSDYIWTQVCEATFFLLYVASAIGLLNSVHGGQRISFEKKILALGIQLMLGSSLVIQVIL